MAISRHLPCVLSVLCALALNPTGASAQARFDPAARAATIAPLVDDQTIAVAHVDLDRLDADAVVKLLGEVAPPGEPGAQAQVARIGQALKALKTAFRSGGIHELYAIVNLQDFPKEPVLIAAPIAAGGDKAANQPAPAEVLQVLTRLPAADTIGNLVVAGYPDTIARLKAHRPAPRPDLAKAFALAGDTAAQAIVSPTDDTRRVIREMLPRLPDELGGGSGAVLADGMRWAVLSLDGPPKLSATLSVQAQDQAAAAALRGLALGAIQQARDRLTAAGSTARPTDREAAEALLKLVTPQIKGDQLLVSRHEGDEAVRHLARGILSSMQAVRTAHGRGQSVNNLKQLGLAMHNYHDVYKRLPPQAIRGKDGRALLSWRVAILPYLNEDALYREFRLDEPWDSEHNKKLIARMPPIFASPHLGNDRIARGMTSYLVPLTKAPPAVSVVPPDDVTKPIVAGKDQMIFDLPQGATMAHILDGTSNTIMILESHPRAAAIWTKPDDLVIDPAAPLAQLTGQPGDGFSAVIADGSVHFIRTSVDKSTLWNLLRMNDGNSIGEF